MNPAAFDWTISLLPYKWFCPDFSSETSGKRPWSPNFPQPTSDHVGGFAARLPSHDDLRL
jgi:hypothetical protein